MNQPNIGDISVNYKYTQSHKHSTKREREREREEKNTLTNIKSNFSFVSEKGRNDMKGLD